MRRAGARSGRRSRKRGPLLFGALAAAAVGGAALQAPGLSLAAGAALAGLTGWGVWHPRSSLLCPVTWRLPREDVVALTFDDGPDPEVTPALLDLLLREEVRATFFVTGRAVRARPDIVRRAVAEGHALGNHGDSHSPWTNLWGARRLRRDVERCSQTIEEVSGSRPVAFRPPVGLKNPTLGRVLERAGLVAVTWSRRGGDPERLRGGDVVLLHDGYAIGRRPRADTVAQVEALLAAARDKGLQPVALSADLLPTGGDGTDNRRQRNAPSGCPPE